MSSLLEQSRILRGASLTTGLEDFGNDDFLEPLTLMLHDYERNAALNLRGTLGAAFYLHRMLSNRLKITQIGRDKEVTGQIINKPVFILGLPRTGSTLLHELLAEHTDLRAPVFWETTFLPSGSWGDCLRRAVTHAQIGVLDLLAPKFRSVHSLGTHRPHECVTMQATSLRSMQFHAIHRLTEYNRWLATCNWTPAYLSHQTHLQWLQQLSGYTNRWILKAPGHLLGIKHLLSVYPDAQFVQLHRNPLEVVPSMASMFVHLRRPFSHRLDHAEIGRDVTAQWHKGLMDTLAARQADPKLDSRFIDVNYADLVAAPVETANKILSAIGLESNEASERCFRRYIANNPKGKHGRHTYSLEQFNLSADHLNSLFRDYNQKYALISKPVS